MKIFNFIRKLLKKILFPNTYSSDAYINYLRKKGVSIGKGCYIWSPNHTFIDVQRSEMLEIGEYCKITRGVIILNHDYSMSVIRRKYHIHIGDARKTKIGNNVFIGMNAIILMGTHIGNNCIVGAGAVVSGRFDDDVVIAGNPARVVCTIEEYYKKHRENQYSKAAEFYFEMQKKRGYSPSIDDMGNAFAWMYLPRSLETVDRYRHFFHLSGDQDEEVIKDFLENNGEFSSYEEFEKSLKTYIKEG
jgi:acetyltransferase-like isoleucine patch superfamily enzyme